MRHFTSLTPCLVDRPPLSLVNFYSQEVLQSFGVALKSNYSQTTQSCNSLIRCLCFCGLSAPLDFEAASRWVSCFRLSVNPSCLVWAEGREQALIWTWVFLAQRGGWKIPHSQIKSTICSSLETFYTDTEMFSEGHHKCRGPWGLSRERVHSWDMDFLFSFISVPFV